MARILMIHDDLEIRQVVNLFLSRLGHSVLESEDGETGLEVATREEPDLIITDVTMPGIDGWEVVRTLRSQAGTALIPVIFLTALSSRSDRMRGFRLGADDFLPKPFDESEFGYCVQRVLASGTEIGNDAQALLDPDLEGRLERIGLPSLLMMLEMERKSGRLQLCFDEVTCEIQMRDGQLVAAGIMSAELGGPEAVYRALEWTSGSFRFCEEPIDGDDTIGLNTMQLLMEGARRIDEMSSMTA